MGEPAPLSFRARLWWVLTAFGLLYLIGPGILTPDGFGWLVPAALALWVHAASRPGPTRLGVFAAEAIASAIAWTLILSWAGKVYWALLVWMGPGMGLYTAWQGLCLRRIGRRFPLALAAPAAWMLSETVRGVLEPPAGFEWARLGMWLHDVPLLNQGARVFGLPGLGWVAVALSGLAVDLARGRRDLAALAAGLGPAVFALGAGLLVPPGPTVEGPEVVLIQPGTAQERKMEAPYPYELFAEAVELTRRGVREARAAGRPPADLVAWGETMLHTPVMEPGLFEAVESGVRGDPWLLGGRELSPNLVGMLDQKARNWVDVGLFDSWREGGDGALEVGTAFVSGADYWLAHGGKVRRMNTVVVWEGPGPPSEPVGKLHLVPTGETMMGLERFAFVRDLMYRMAGYIPDLLRDDDPDRTLEFTARNGRTYRMGISICFDNAFDDVYSLPLRRGPLDFHLVASNEAWFELTQEADQMVAFSRLQAIATDRAVVRATNSGVSICLDARGRELGRVMGVARDGSGLRDRESTGTLAVRVPVPAEGSSGRQTPWVRFSGLWTLLWILAPLGLLWRSGSRPRFPVTNPASGA